MISTNASGHLQLARPQLALGVAARGAPRPIAAAPARRLGLGAGHAEPAPAEAAAAAAHAVRPVARLAAAPHRRRLGTRPSQRLPSPFHPLPPSNGRPRNRAPVAVFGPTLPAMKAVRCGSLVSPRSTSSRMSPVRAATSETCRWPTLGFSVSRPARSSASPAASARASSSPRKPRATWRNSVWRPPYFPMPSSRWRMRRSARRVGSGSVCGEPTPGGGGGGRVAASAVRASATSSGRRAAPARAPRRAASSAVHSQAGLSSGSISRAPSRCDRLEAHAVERARRLVQREPQQLAGGRRVVAGELERQEPLPGPRGELRGGAGRRLRQIGRHHERLGTGGADAAGALARRPVVVAGRDRQHERDGVRPHGGEHRDRARP